MIGLSLPRSTPFVRNLGSMGSAQLAIRLTRLATTVALARLLTPNDYGLAAIVLTVNELISLFTRNGISAKVVQATAEDVEAVAQTAWTMTWIVCVALMLLQAAAAYPIAVFYGDTRLALPIALMGTIYLATPVSNIQGAFIQREGRMGRIAFTGALQVVADNILTAVLALCGLGMWAILLPKLLVAPIWAIGLRTGHKWRPARKPSLAGWRDIAAFSRAVVGIEVMTTLQANIDNLIVGSILGVEALGLYYFAFNAGLGISLGLVNSFGTAVFPHLCEVRGNPAMLANRFAAARRTVSGIVVPLVLLQVALAPFYVPIVFGSKWTPAIPVLMAISLSAVARPFASVASQLLKAVGRPDIELKWQSWTTVSLIVALLAGTAFGVMGVAIAVLLVQSLSLSLYAWRAPSMVLRGSDDTRFQLIRTETEFLALEAEWNALWSRADRPFLSSTFAWCLAGWRTTGVVREREIAIVAMREAGRLVLVWPMTLRRRFGTTIALPMGPESSEYDALLVEAGTDAARRVREAWDYVRTLPGLHLVKMPFMREGTSVHSALIGAAAATHALPAPAVGFIPGSDWNAYWRTRSSNLRHGFARRRKRLAEQGTVVHEWVEDDKEFEHLLDWTLDRKKAWMKERGLANEFIAESEYRRFLLTLRASSVSGGHLAMMVLRVNGIPVATKIGCIDGTRYEGFITVYDPAWSHWLPGQILLADCLAWCHANGLDYDFRIGEEAYKRDWANVTVLSISAQLPTGLIGSAIVRMARAHDLGRVVFDRIRQSLPRELRRRIKACLPNRMISRGAAA